MKGNLAKSLVAIGNAENYGVGGVEYNNNNNNSIRGTKKNGAAKLETESIHQHNKCSKYCETIAEKLPLFRRFLRLTFVAIPYYGDFLEKKASQSFTTIHKTSQIYTKLATHF